jgi:lysophospholipase L1-like esterase
MATTTAVAFGGCGGGSGAPRVAVIGDSLTALAQPELSRVLMPGYDVSYLYRISVRTDQMLELVANDSHDNGPAWGAVVNLGTNDAIQGRSTAEAVGAYDQLLAILRPTRCVVLTTVSIAADTGGRTGVAAALNRRIAAAVDMDPTRYRVVDWNGFLAGLDATARSTYLRSDGIHESGTGARWMASADRAALDDCRRGARLPLLGPAA